MRWIVVIRILVIVFTLLSTWFFAEQLFSSKLRTSSLRDLFDNMVKNEKVQKKDLRKCGNDKDCPQNYFAFKVISGAANVVGPSMCLDGKMDVKLIFTEGHTSLMAAFKGPIVIVKIMSGVRNNVGKGLNIALVNATSGHLIKTGHFDMYSGDVKDALTFFEPVQDGTLIFIASFDDPATKLDDKARDLLTSYGSSYAKKLGFRDSWVFVGGKGLKNKSPFEQHIKNDQNTNKYDGWPEVLEISGCIPRKMG